jgi:hypothetical protein
MLFTVSHARDYLAVYVKGNPCKSSQAVLDAINNATMELLNVEDWWLTVCRMKFGTMKNMIATPREVERVIAYKVEGIPFAVKSQFYEFLDGGTWSSDWLGDGHSGLVDWGDQHPTMFEIDAENAPTKIMAWSTSADDVGKTLFVRGFRDGGHEVLTDGVPGEQVEIRRWTSGVEGVIEYSNMRLSAGEYTQITNVIKPVTKGYVSLMAYDDSTHYTWNLAKYHPLETNPQFHRYKVPSPRCIDGTCITALVKMRYIPAELDTDVLIIQNLPALREAVLAEKYRESDPNRSGAYLQNSIAMLTRDNTKKHPVGQDVTIAPEWGIGTITVV